MIVMARHTILRLLTLCGYVLIIGQSRTVSSIDIGAVIDSIIKQPFTLEDIYYRVFYPLGFNGTWISDNEIMTVNMLTHDVTVHNVKTGKTTLLFDGARFPLDVILTYLSFSPDKRYFLFGYDSQQIFRYSTVARYVVFDTKNGTLTEIANSAPVSLALWSPAGNDLVYVYNRDVYHMRFKDGQTVPQRITTSGESEDIYNGIPDWVYEEEVYASATAMWYSPDGRHLAFATFNDTEVRDVTFSYYGEPGSLHDQYPTPVKIKYPKVGTSNPVVTLTVIDLIDPSSKAVLAAPVDEVGSDHVLFTVSWWNATRVLATWTNRVQTASQLVMYDTRGAGSSVLEDEETEGWLQPNRPVRAGGGYALLLRRVDSGSSAGRFQHVIRYVYDGDEFVSPVDLTPGPSEVHDVVAVDSSRNRVYYLATAPGEPGQRNLYSVPLDASQEPTCISCELLTPEGNKCTYASAAFSQFRSYYALLCAGPDPTTVTIHDSNHQSILMWKENWLVRKMLSLQLMPQRRDFNVTVNGYNCTVRLMLPHDFDESKSYPMLVHVYSGPNSIRITEAVKYDLEYYMTTNRRVIYALIDGRGSAFKGSKMLFEIYRKMGTVEIEDTIAVTAALHKQYKWIDASRTGIWGWSYGGFTTAMTLATDVACVFKCGIAVAPVTSWIYYDSIYTERFMGLPTPEDNLAGYNRTDVTRQIGGIRGKKFMLIHGTADDNVHFQQALALAKSLEHDDILFEQVTYTDEAHDLRHVYAHFYHTMDKFWGECFDWDRAR